MELSKEEIKELVLSEIDELVGLARKCLDLTAEAIENGALNN